MAEIGWDPEWEVNPKELKLVERIGEGRKGDRGYCSLTRAVVGHGELVVETCRLLSWTSVWHV
jgi:hypothetical protein